MAASAPPGHPPEGDRFVGREAEIARLESLRSRARDGHGTIVFLTGDAGTGKTALAGEFLRRTRRIEPPMTVTRGRCLEQYGSGEAYLPFLDALGKLLRSPLRAKTLDVMRVWAPTWCLQLPGAFPESLESLQSRAIGTNRERMMREAGDALEQAVSQFPIVLVLEDLQWADASSIDLIRYLALRTVRRPMMMVGTFRPGDVGVGSPLERCLAELRGQGRAQEIPLPPFDEGTVRLYLDARLAPHDLPAHLPALLRTRTEGHPLFLAGLVQLLAEHGDVVYDGERWHLARPMAPAELETPQSVRDMVGRTLAALSEEDRAVLQVASVLGREFPSAVLARVLEADEIALEERLERLRRVHRLLENRGEEETAEGRVAVLYRFSHAPYAEILYADVVARRRMLLHRQATEALVAHYGREASRHAGALALHSERAREWGPAIDWLLAAADNAARLFAWDEAVAHCDRGLQLAERLPPPEGGPRAAALRARRGRLLHAMGRFDDAADELGRAREQARALGLADLEWGALAGRTLSLFFARRIEEMAVGAADLLLVSARSGAEAQRAEALVLTALVLIDTGSLGEAAPLLDEALDTSRRMGPERVMFWCRILRGVTHYFQSEYARAEEQLGVAVKLALAEGDGFKTLVSQMFWGQSKANQGRMSEALADFEEAIALARRNGDHVWLPRLVSHVGWVRRELQDFQGAHRLDEEALAIAREHRGEAWAPESEALLNLSFDFVQGGQDEEAQRVAEQLEGVSGEGVFFGWFNRVRWQAARAEHALLRGQLDLASSLATELIETATRHQTRIYALACRRVLAEAAMASGQLEEADEQLEEALALLREFPCTLESWKTHTALGRLRVRQGREAEARAAFGRAEAVVLKMAEHVRDEELRALFLASPRVVDVREGAAGTTPALPTA